MNRKNFRSISILLALMLFGLTAAAPATHLKQYKVSAGSTIEIGRQGIAFTNVPLGVTHVLAGVVKGDDLPARYNHDVNIKLFPPALEVRFLGEEGGAVNRINAIVHIFFNLSKAERALWDQAGIAIWYASEATGKWQPCTTSFVEGVSGYGRLACLATGSGYYILGSGAKPGQRTSASAAAVDGSLDASAPRVYAQFNDDSIRYEYAAPGAIVNFSIFDAPGGNLLWSGSDTADQQGFAFVSFQDHQMEIVPGIFIVVISGRATNELVVEAVTFDTFDPDENVVSGTATPGRDVWVGLANGTHLCELLVAANPEGVWSVDFDDHGCDLTMDVGAYAQIFDAEYDTTEVWWIPGAGPFSL